MINPNAYNPVSPVYTGVIASETADPRLIGRRILPRVPVTSQQYIGQIVRENARMWRSLASGGIESKPGTDFKTISSRDPDTLAYAVKRYGLASDPGIPFEYEARNQLPFSLRERETRMVFRGVELAEEDRLHDFIFNASTWTNNTTVVAIPSGGGAKWSAPGSTPLADLRQMAIQIRNRTGHWPDTLVMGQTVADTLVEHADIITAQVSISGVTVNIDRFTTEPQLRAILSRKLSIPEDRIFIGSALASTANDGQAESLGYIWEDNVWMGVLTGANAMADGAVVYATPTAALGLDEVGLLNAYAPGMASLTNGFMAQEIFEKKAWKSEVWQYATEVALLPNLAQYATDAV